MTPTTSTVPRKREEETMRNLNRGRSRLLRGAAVVGLTLTMTVASTTPSQALGVAPVIPTVAALPSTIVPASAIGISGTTAAAAGVCAATIYCGLAVVAGAALLSIGAGLLWTYKQTPNTDVIANGVVTWGTYPYLSGSYMMLTMNFPAQRPAAVKAASPNLRICNVSSTYTTSCNSYTWSDGQTRFPTTGTHSQVVSSSSTALGVIVQVLRSGTSSTWDTVISADYAGRTGNVGQTFPTAPSFQGGTTDPNRRLKQETRCTNAAGTSRTVTTYSPTYKHTDANRPAIQIADCGEGERSTGVKATEEKQDTSGNWSPSTWTTPESTTPGVVADIQFPSTVITPTYEHADCIIGSLQCTQEIVVKTPNGYQTCDVADCGTFADDAAAVAAGTKTWADTEYRCEYGGKIISVAECAPAQEVTVAPPTYTPNPTTPDDGTGCAPSGWSMLNPFAYVRATTCVLTWAFVPTDIDTPLTQVQTAYNSTAIGVVTTAVNDFGAPLVALSTTNKSNIDCKGIEITLPASLAGEDYEDIKAYPFAACDGVQKTLSDFMLTVSTGGVYIAGLYTALNVLLGAFGMNVSVFRSRDVIV